LPSEGEGEEKGGKMLYSKLLKLFVVMAALALAMVPCFAEAG